MLDLKEIKELEKIKSSEKSIISLYLDTDQKRKNLDQIKTALKNLLKIVRDKIEPETIEKIRETVILRLDPKIKGMVFFISSKPELWQVIRLPQSVRDLVVSDYSPYIKPLIKLLDEFERYCLVVLDKEKAKVFTVYLGKIEEHKDVFSYPKFPGRHDQGGWSQMRMQRHTEVHIKRLIHSLNKQIFSFFRKNNFDRLIIAGSKEILPEFKKNLHPYLKQRLAGEFLTEMFMPLKHFLDQSLKIEEKIEREKEDKLVKELIENIGRGKGVAGLGKVLSAVQKKKIQTLIVSFEFKRPGFYCEKCGFISIIPQLKICPYCKIKMKEVDDVIEKLIEEALNQNAKIEFVKDNKELEKMGKVGVILRF